MTQEKIAFVLGNGVSRKSIDPHALKLHGKTYGCNALYRTFAPVSYTHLRAHET